MLSRRNFVKQTGLLALAAASPSLVSGMTNSKEKAPKKKQKIAVNNHWDVIVVGGGPSGCTAAISAAREGAKTLLIEAMGQLGGMGTLGMVPAWCPFSDGEKIIYRGLAEKVFREAQKGVPHEPADKLDWVSINPEQLVRVYDKMVAESGAKVLFFSRLAAVEMAGNQTIDALIVANKAGLTAFKAKVYIDATGDGDMAAWAGASFKRGDDQGVVQSSTLCFSFANVDSYNYTYGPALYGGHKTSPIHQAIASGKYPLIDKHLGLNYIGPDVIQFNAGHLTNVDSTDPWAVSEAMMKGREIASQYLDALKEVQPQTFGGAFLARTANLLGVRDSRR
ncbi:MAG: FAD-dependent oxidoreductase, partial [Candidatus Symbiothrix sp.]|nr:FAD-dependent oxidoreductase [Candidatus Symbiothrix sp.]